MSTWARKCRVMKPPDIGNSFPMRTKTRNNHKCIGSRYGSCKITYVYDWLLDTSFQRYKEAGR
jgi:hypothetical protein